MTVSGFRVQEIYRASKHVRMSGIVGIRGFVIGRFQAFRSFREIMWGKSVEAGRSGIEDFRKDFWKV